MHCIKCGENIPTESTSCLSCGEKARQPELISRQNQLVSLLIHPLVFSIILVLFIGGVSFGLFKLYRKVVLPDPARTVEAFYAAVEEHDKDKALSYVHPDMQELGLGFNLELLMQPNVNIQYEDTKFKTVSRDKTSARVRITGKAKVDLEGKSREIVFNDEASLAAVDGSWYLEHTSLSDLFAL